MYRSVERKIQKIFNFIQSFIRIVSFYNKELNNLIGFSFENIWFVLHRRHCVLCLVRVCQEYHYKVKYGHRLVTIATRKFCIGTDEKHIQKILR